MTLIFNNCDPVSGWVHIETTSNLQFEDEELEFCTAVPPAACENDCLFYYRVTAINLFEETEPTNEFPIYLLDGQPQKASSQNITQLPNEYFLEQNYPNPFNPSTKISFSLRNDDFVVLKIYDILGREVKELVNEKLDAGKYTYEFNAADLSSGIYFYQLRTDKYRAIKKLQLVK